MQFATCQTGEIHIITSVKDNFASLNVPRWTCYTSAYAIIACDKSFHIPCLQIELNNEPPSCNILRLLYPALHSSGERFHILSLTPVRITDVFTPLCNCSDAGIPPVSHLISSFRIATPINTVLFWNLSTRLTSLYLEVPQDFSTMALHHLQVCVHFDIRVSIPNLVKMFLFTKTATVLASCLLW